MDEMRRREEESDRIDPCSLADALALGVYNSVYNEDSSDGCQLRNKSKIPRRQIELHRKRK